MAKGIVHENCQTIEPVLTFAGYIRGVCLYSTRLDRYALQTDYLKINKYFSPTDRSFLKVSEKISEMCANTRMSFDVGKIVRVSPLDLHTC